MVEVSPSRRRALRLLAAAPALVAMSRAAAQPAPRITRPIPASGEPLPVIGLGTWQSFDAGGGGLTLVRAGAERGR